MQYRSGNLRKTVVPSVINSGGTTVFIPEKGIKAGRIWFKKYTYYNLAVFQSNLLLFSFTTQIQLVIQINVTTLVLTAPFTLETLRFYQQRAAQQAKAHTRLAMRVADQSPDELPKISKNEFEEKKNRDSYHNARLIYALGGAIFKIGMQEW